jgi:hypothetical protein
MFYLNETPVLMEGCKVGLCDWEFLKEKFGQTADGCDLSFCYNSNVASTLNSHEFIGIFTIGLVILRSLFIL